MLQSLLKNSANWLKSFNAETVHGDDSDFKNHQGSGESSLLQMGKSTFKRNNHNLTGRPVSPGIYFYTDYNNYFENAPRPQTGKFFESG